MNKFRLTSNLCALLLLLISSTAGAQTSQPKEGSKEYFRNIELASKGMQLAATMDRTTAAGIAAIESTYEIYRKLCEEYENLQGCSQLLYPATEHPTRAKVLESKSIAILKSKCEKFGYANEDGEFCYHYGSALSHSGQMTSALEIFKKRCAAPGGASSCMTVAFALPKTKSAKASRAEVFSFARRACELDLDECALALKYYSDGPDARFFETQTEKVCSNAPPDEYAWSCIGLAEYKWQRGKVDEATRLFETSCHNGNAWGCTYSAAISLSRNDRLKAKDSLREPCAERAQKVLEQSQRQFFDRICPELQAGREIAAQDSEFVIKQLRGIASASKP